MENDYQFEKSQEGIGNYKTLTFLRTAYFAIFFIYDWIFGIGSINFRILTVPIMLIYILFNIAPYNLYFKRYFRAIIIFLNVLEIFSFMTLALTSQTYPYIIFMSWPPLAFIGLCTDWISTAILSIFIGLTVLYSAISQIIQEDYDTFNIWIYSSQIVVIYLEI